MHVFPAHTRKNLNPSVIAVKLNPSIAHGTGKGVSVKHIPHMYYFAL